MYAHTADNAADVPAIIEGFYGAGRLNHGDIHFDIPDETVVTNGHQQPLPALASILDSYESGVLKSIRCRKSQAKVVLLEIMVTLGDIPAVAQVVKRPRTVNTRDS